MAEQAAKVAVKTETKARPTPEPEARHPLASLRQEMERLFDDFAVGGSPLWPRRRRFGFGPLWSPPLSELSWRWPSIVTGVATPAVDVAETDTAYQITAELPGMDEKNVEVTVSEGVLTIKGEKSEEKEEKEKDYYLSERRYGAFQRSFQVPDGVDTDRIDASFKNGVLTLTLPKTPEARKKQRRIAVKAET